MSLSEETQVPEVVDQAVETHEKKSPQESFAELRQAKEQLERQLWQAQQEKEFYEKQLAEKDQKIQILETATEFADFKEVVTPENIEKYIKSDEDNREAVQTAKNPLRKVYNLIKKSAAYQADKAEKVAKDKPISQEQRRVDEKEGKPKLGSLGVRSEAVTVAAKMSNSTMTKDQKNALWKETLAASRR